MVHALERLVMETVYIYPLATLRPCLRRRLYEARAPSRAGVDRVRRDHVFYRDTSAALTRLKQVQRVVG